MNNVAALEGLLFVVGDEGLSVDQIQDILEVTLEDINYLINILNNKYKNENSGISLSFLGNRYKLTTKKEYKEYYKKLVDNEESNTLSAAALETLAIIAYNQPLTRMVVDKIRGVQSSHIIRNLVSKGLIEETGRSDSPGRPIIYGTTSLFLDYFGLSTIDNLPEIEHIEIEEDDTETDLYESKYIEEE